MECIHGESLMTRTFAEMLVVLRVPFIRCLSEFPADYEEAWEFAAKDARQRELRAQI